MIDTPAFFDAGYYALLYGGVGGYSNWFGYENEELQAAIDAMLDPATMDDAIRTTQRIFARTTRSIPSPGPASTMPTPTSWSCPAS